MIVSYFFLLILAFLPGGTIEGKVGLWNIGLPMLPDYSNVSVTQLMSVEPNFGDIHNLVVAGDNQYLLASTKTGLIGWSVNTEEVMTSSTQNQFQ
jgi:hypothetical protein